MTLPMKQSLDRDPSELESQMNKKLEDFSSVNSWAHPEDKNTSGNDEFNF